MYCSAEMSCSIRLPVVAAVVVVVVVVGNYSYWRQNDCNPIVYGSRAAL